jgi:lysyl-tRNA synthetase class 2
LVALLGAVSVISALLPALRPRLGVLVEVVPRYAPPVATGFTLATGFVLIAVSRGLRRGKRHAWAVAVCLAAAAVALHLLKGLDVEEATLSAAVLAGLLATRRAFPAAADRPSWPAAMAVVAGAPAVAVLTGTAYLALRPRAIVGHPPLRLLAVQAAAGLVGLDGPVGFTSPHAATRTALLLATLGLTTTAGLLVVLLRASAAPPARSAEQTERLRALLRQHGELDSLSYFALRSDRSCIFSPTGKAAITYRVVGSVSLAAGDPIGDPEAWPGAIQAWLDDAARHAWVPAVLAAGERAASAFARHGLDALEIGDEAILDVAAFGLGGRDMRAVRQAVNRVRRAGITAAIERTGDLPPDVLDAVTTAADRWRVGRAERGFSMALGRFGDPSDGACVLVRATDGAGVLRGLLHLVPWGRHGLSLDLMRRDRNSDNGLVEFMVTELMAAAPGIGVRHVSLNFAMFRSTFARGERIGAGPALRTWRRILLVASRFWQIESLYRSNRKYRPIWTPRFVCFRAARDLPRIAIAALEAEAFIGRPFKRRPAVSRCDPAAGVAPARC